MPHGPASHGGLSAGFTLCREHFRIAIRHNLGFGIATQVVGARFLMSARNGEAESG
jgi:hypothetical protein